MERDPARRITRGEARADERAPVAALHREALVAQARHQLGKTLGDLFDAEARLAGLERERVARQRWRHYGEVLGQERDQFQKLDDRPRPAVREQERHGIYPTARLVDEVQLDAVQRHGELPQAVDARFVRAPVEALLPMSHELSQMGEASPGRPGLERRLVRKARARQTLAQIGERGFGNVEFEWLDAQLCR